MQQGARKLRLPEAPRRRRPGDAAALFQVAQHVGRSAARFRAAGQDVMRAAVAVDGSKRVWVFWSANQKGNFDIYAAIVGWRVEGRQMVAPMRVTSDPGTDVNPVAATDSQGPRVGRLAGLPQRQSGDPGRRAERRQVQPRERRFPSRRRAIGIRPSPPRRTAKWRYPGTPTTRAITTSTSAACVRRAAASRWIRPTPVAATQNFEARSSVAYDSKNRLWVAYEASEKKWGKDFGAYETTGVALYQDHNVKVKCFPGKDAFATADDLPKRCPAADAAQRRARREEEGRAAGLGRRSRSARRCRTRRWPPRRAPSLTPQCAAAAAEQLSAGSRRIPTGTVYLTFRAGGQPGALGDGQRLDGGGGLLRRQRLERTDVRSAHRRLARHPAGDGGARAGRLLLVTTTDHRQDRRGVGHAAAAAQRARRRSMPISTQPSSAYRRAARRTPSWLRLPPEKVAPPQPDVKPEAGTGGAACATIAPRSAASKLQIMRGEFHRHTEISGDGGRDGPLIDAYRYMIDAAYMDWGGCCDHDNGAGREYYLVDRAEADRRLSPGRPATCRCSPTSAACVIRRDIATWSSPQRGIRPLPRLPKMADEFAAGARARHADALRVPEASSTASWRRTPPAPTWAPTGATTIRRSSRWSRSIRATGRTTRCRARRAPTPQDDSIGGWRPLGFVSLALKKGYRLGFQASSDHISTHMSYCNLWVTVAHARRHHGGVPQAARLRRDRQHPGRRALRQPLHGRGVHHVGARPRFR